MRDLRVEPRWREWTAAARADYEAWQRARAAARRRSISASASRISASACPDAIVDERRRQLLRLGAPLLALARLSARQLAPTSGAMGYGVPAALAAKALEPEPHRRLLRRRRRLPDERPGARDRGAVRPAGRRPRRRQRDVRDDPHAPGAARSRAASSAPTSSTPTSPPTPARSARTARTSSAPRSSRRRSSARSTRDGRRCSRCGSTRRRSRRARR